MRGGLIGSVCFLAFLFFQNSNGQNLLGSQHPLSEADKVGDDESSGTSVSRNSAEANSQEVSKVQDDDGSKLSQDKQAPESHEQVTLQNPEGQQRNDDLIDDDEDGIEDKAGYSLAISNGVAKFMSSNFPGNSVAHAFSQSGTGTYPQTLANVSPYGSTYPSLAQAYGNTQAISSTGSDTFSGYFPSIAPPSPYMGLGSAYSSADALAQTDAGGWSPYGPGYASAIAQAQAKAQTDSERWNPFNPGVTYPDSSFASAAAQAQADSGGWNPYGPGLTYPDLSYATAAAQAEASSGGWSPYGPGFNPGSSYASDEAQPTSTALYRPENARSISPREYIIPNSITGQINIKCTYAGEMFSIWTEDQQCLICACSSIYGKLTPVCVGCNSCLPTLPPVPEPAPLPIPLPPLPPPEPQVSCSPLPDNVPFPNPMNPCQICICKHVFNAIGQLDVQINCEENPECGGPPDITPIPPIPVPPQPVPMPLCENFPPNVQFPHPYESCKICECVVEVLSFGIPEQRIICIPNPECEEFPPIPEPIEPWHFPEPQPEPWPVPPLPEPYHPIPQPLPPPPEPWLIPEPIQTVPEQFPPIPEPWPIPFPEPWQPEQIPEPIPIPEPQPLPWPPLLPDLPPSPLPGPPPHRSCRPYPPNQSFQHPWDECQVCVCREYYGADVINIEVNCFTKPSCCIEPAIPEPPPGQFPFPPPHLRPEPIPQPIQYLDQSCQYQDIGSEFISAVDVCKVCTCELFGNFVAPACRRSSRPECAVSPAPATYDNLVYIEPECRYRMPNQPFAVDCNVCSCQPVFNYVIARCTPNPNCGGPFTSSLGSFGSAEASANAQANAYGLGQPFSQTESISSAFANSASSEAVALADVLSNLNPNQGSLQFLDSIGSIDNQYPYGAVFPGTNAGSAEPLPNVQSGLMNTSPVPSYPYYGDASALAQAESLAVPPGLAYSQALSSAIPFSTQESYSAAEALANSQASSSYPGVYGGYPYYAGLNELGQNAQAQSSTITASQLYPNLYQYPVSQVTGLYQPDVSGVTGMVGQLGSGASAQSLAQVSAISGRPLIRSGPGLCKYGGDKYHHNCQACYCFLDSGSGSLYTLCLGNPCG